MLRLVDRSVDLPKRIQWDAGCPADQAIAQGKINVLREMGYTVQEESEGEILLSPPPMAPHQLLIRVLDDNGDSRVTWDRRNQAECDEARTKFDEYLKKGYRAYVCRSDGTKGQRVETFDALLEEVIVAPGKPGDKGFGEYHKPRESVLVPPTAPG